jgi:hypothetical protein
MIPRRFLGFVPVVPDFVVERLFHALMGLARARGARQTALSLPHSAC